MKSSFKHMKAQTTLEFTFAFVIVLLLVYGCIQVFRWAGVSLVERQKAHESTLIDNTVLENWQTFSQSPLKQLGADFYEPSRMNAVFNNW